MNLGTVLYTVIIYPITFILEVVFFLAQKIFKAPGVSVLAISAVVSILCLPLYNVAEKWQQLERDTQKRLAPKIAKIKAAFKGDEQYMILSTFYRQNHYHPIFALRSTFGLLIQIPFFIAAYAYLSRLEALKGAPFLFISDLGAPDALFPINRFPINVLPIAMTAINIIAGAIYTKGFPFKEKAQLYGMALIFLVLLYNSPAGLVLYWTANNLFSLLKNAYAKAPFRRKNSILAAAVSVLCLLFAAYMLFVHHGSKEWRRVLATAGLLVGASPWLVFFVIQAVKRIPPSRNPCSVSNKEAAALFTLLCLVMWLVAGLFLPTLLVAASPEEFSWLDRHGSPLYFIILTALQAFGLFVFWPFCFFGLFYRTAPRALCVTALAVAAAALVNVFAFNGNYGVVRLNMSLEHGVSHSLQAILVNLAVLLLVMGAAALAFFAKKRFLVPLSFICIVALAGVSVKNIAHIQSVFKKTTAYHEPKAAVTSIDPIVTFSKTGRNVVIIMFDRAMSAFVPHIFGETPGLAARYDGFTYYPDTLSFNSNTSLGAPPLFGGYEYTPAALTARKDRDMVTKHNEALLLMPRLLSDAGYDVTVADPPYPNYSIVGKDLRIYDAYPRVKGLITDGAYTDLWLREHGLTLPTQSAVLERNMLWYSLLRVIPLAFREGIYFRGDWLSAVGKQLTIFLNAYSVLDLLPRLCAVADGAADADAEGDEKGAALIMVNNTTHDPAMCNAPDYRFSLAASNYGAGPFAKESPYHGSAAAYHRLADWFDNLRAKGVYDNTRIILVADHGTTENYVSKHYPGVPNIDNFNPLLMVKDFDTQGSLKTDDTFMTNADTPFLALHGLVSPLVNPATGAEITAGTVATAKSLPLYVAVLSSDSIYAPQALAPRLDPAGDYYVHGTIFDPGNWEKVEVSR
ncbi:membrane protein [Spirochaetia bacterium]|nr:membrane protein [Spirochaetia bacterium]